MPRTPRWCRPSRSCRGLRAPRLERRESGAGSRGARARARSPVASKRASRPHRRSTRRRAFHCRAQRRGRSSSRDGDGRHGPGSTKACSGVSIDGTAPPMTEPAVLVVADDVVLVDPGGMNGLEGPDPIEIEKGQPGRGHRPEIAARALDRQDSCRRTRDRVGEGRLRRRVPAGEVGDTLVGAESVGSRQQGDDGRVIAHACQLISHVR